MMNKLLNAFSATALLFISAISVSYAETHEYSCPMHPEVVGEAGDMCPKCDMELEPSSAKTDKNQECKSHSTAADHQSHRS
ncbi:MAG: heavy metal-binding domain-containing protein [Vibrionaceae bacterium]